MYPIAVNSGMAIGDECRFGYMFLTNSILHLALGNQEGVAEDHCQALQAESFHQSGELQPHHAH